MIYSSGINRLSTGTVRSSIGGLGTKKKWPDDLAWRQSCAENIINFFDKYGSDHSFSKKDILKPPPTRVYSQLFTVSFILIFILFCLEIFLF